MMRSGLLREVLERRLAVRSIEHLVSLRAKPHAEELADGRLVIDHEDADGWSAHAASSNVSASVVTGRVMVNTAPVSVRSVPGRDGAAHGLDEASRDRQAKPGSRTHPIALLCPIEFIEDALQILRRDTRPLVHDLKAN